MSIKKRDIIRSIAHHLRMPETLIEIIVNRIFGYIAETIRLQGKLELRKFGVFEVVKRKARRGRDISKGKEIEIPAKLTIVFRPSDFLLKSVFGENKGVGNSTDVLGRQP